jgi:hypothetical protein
MYNPFSAFCDDFYVNMRLSTQLNLPHARETVLHFFERLQKEFPALTRFRKHENGDLCLEENRDSESYRWATLESRRLLAGHVNPPSVEEAMKIHTLLLQLAPFDLGISPLEVDYLDVLFGFDLSFRGNHDEVVAESLMQQSPLTALLEESGAKAVDIQPTVTVALSEDCRLQARIDIITRTNSYQVRTGDYNNDVISVYLVLRRYCGDRPRDPMEQIFAGLVEKAQTLCDSYIVPKVLRPLSSAIASRS